MRTKKFMVAYATFDHNAHNDALSCGVFGKAYPTLESAHEAVVAEIMSELRDEIAIGGADGETAESLFAECVWRDTPQSVCCDLRCGLEEVYEIQEVRA